MKKFKDQLSIRWNLFSYFVIFLVFLLVLLWVFQVGFLESFYRGIKKRSVERTAAQVIQNYQEDQGLASLERYAIENEFHIRIVSNQGILISESVGVPSIWIHDILSSQYQRIYLAAYQNGGTVYIQFENTASYYKDNSEYITYVSIVDDTTMVVIQALIVPVGATVSTLKVQLFIISGILALAAVIFSWFVSRQLSNPLILLNQEAKRLGLSLDAHPFDATGYKEVNELSQTLNDAHLSLKEVDRMRKELLANVSHDFKTPLTMIQGYGELIRDIPSEDNTENAQVIVDEAQHLGRLVDDLLDLSKLQDGIDTLNLERLDMKKVLADVVGRYQSIIGLNQSIQTDIDKHYWVKGDSIKIHQVLYNLVNNALQHGGDTVSVVLRCTQNNDHVRVEVIDNGPGMDEKESHMVWERYVRSETNHTREKIGSGIGLSIVKHVLQLHGVPFGVNSQVGEGSTFWFELNLEKEETQT